MSFIAVDAAGDDEVRLAELQLVDAHRHAASELAHAASVTALVPRSRSGWRCGRPPRCPAGREGRLCHGV